MWPNFALFLLINPKNELLLLRRINTPFCNQCYSLPGGKIEAGETATNTIIREAKGSLGITIMPQDIHFAHVMHRKCNEPEFFACVFRITHWEGVPHNQQQERHDDLQWFPLQALPTAMVPAHCSALDMMQQNKLYSEHGW